MPVRSMSTSGAGVVAAVLMMSTLAAASPAGSGYQILTR